MKMAMRVIVVGLTALLVAGPSFAGKKDGGAFFDMTVEMKMACSFDCTDYTGRFSLSGAVSDRGSAFADSVNWLGELMQLDGKQGSLTIGITDIAVVGGSSSRHWEVLDYSGTFTIVAGSGTYTALEGLTGSASGSLQWRVRGSHGDADDLGKPVPYYLTWALTAGAS